MDYSEDVLTPRTPGELAEALGSAGSRGLTVSLGGAFSKRLMAGPVEPSDCTISTVGLARVLQYEPQDLTISVEAGMRYCELSRMLAEHRQMIPLDPPFGDTATVGGVVAANCSGPRRRAYGTARDLIIGMKFATLEGKLVESGGMVVKNVAGLDMAKLMVGSFGTLAAIAVVNFKLLPRPEKQRSFLLSFDTLAGAITARDKLLSGVLQPVAVDLLSPEAAAHLGARGWALAVRAGGNAAAMSRYERELEPLGSGVALEGPEEAALWRYVQEYTPRYLDANPDGAVARVSCTLKEVGAVLATIEGPAVARAGSGVCYGYFKHPEWAAGWAADAVARGWRAVVEFAPEALKSRFELWPSPAGDLEMMKRVKRMFDPQGLLNRGRLYRHI